MNLLAIETATTVCSVALWMDGDVVVELTLNRPRAHAENLVPMISDALRYGGLTASGVEAVTVSAGPGSYTGLRIGASTAKGLCAAIDARLVAVPSLEALAFGARDAVSGDDLLVAAFDSRRNETFAAAFQRSAPDSLAAVRPTSAVRMEEAAEWLGDVRGRIVLVGDGGAKWMDALSAAGVVAETASERTEHPSAGSVALLGAERLLRGETVDVSEFEPHYLKEFVAKKPSTTAFEKLTF